MISVKPGTLDLPDLGYSTQLDREYMVTVFNNDTNTYEEVITILMLATNCDSEEAYMEAWEIDHLGQSTVHLADRETCESVAGIISKIGIRVEVEKNA